MMKKNICIISLVLAVVAALTGCGTQPAANSAANSNTTDHSQMDHGSMDHSTMPSSPNAALADYDLQFLDTMISHHQGAIDMARSIPDRAESPELKKLGENIITAQQREIDEMWSWREKWFAGLPPAVNMELAGMRSSMVGMDVKKLDALSGREFDLEFTRQMVPHHEGAIVMAREALARSERNEIKKLANAIIKEQMLEIAQMKAWQTQWSQ